MYTQTELKQMDKSSLIKIILNNQEKDENVQLIKRYLNGKIFLEDLLKQIECCLPYACSWCKDNCQECDLRFITDEERKCCECHIRCLKKMKKEDL